MNENILEFQDKFNLFSLRNLLLLIFVSIILAFLFSFHLILAALFFLSLLIMFFLILRPDWCLILFFFLLPLFPPEAKIDLGLSITHDRLLLFLFVAGILISKSNVLSSFKLTKAPLWTFFILLSLLNSFHLLFSDNPLETSFENIYIHFTGFLIFFSAYYLSRNKTWNDTIDVVLLTSGIIIAILGIYETLSNHYLFAADIIHRRGEYLRAKATLGNPIPYGVFLSLLLPLSYVRIFTNKSYFKRTVSALISIILLFGITVSISRQAYISALVIILSPIIWLLRKSFIKIKPLFIIFLLIIFLFLLFNVISNEKIHSLLFSEDASDNISSRIHMSLVAVNMFYEHPLFGIGLGNFRYHAYDYSLFKAPKMPVNLYGEAPIVDNSYLTILAETGLTGGIIMFALIFVILKQIKYFLFFKPVNSKKADNYQKRIQNIGFTASLVVLIFLFNGFMVDVFEYKELTFIFWLMVARIYTVTQNSIVENKFLG